MWSWSLLTLLWTASVYARPRGAGSGAGDRGDVSIWIDERQVKEFSGMQMQIFIVSDGRVMPYILDPALEQRLPVVPGDVSTVNFTWRAGVLKEYFYQFDILQSSDTTVLQHPHVTVERQGRVPAFAKSFRVYVNCTGGKAGVVSVLIGLRIFDARGVHLTGTPLRLRLRKECLDSSEVRCEDKSCPSYRRTPLCYPQCMNNGTCVSPGVCSCQDGYQGPQCEGGICSLPCLNGGKCNQKDTCSCRRGYYGPRCEYSKCVIPCLNGRCVGVNRCRCFKGFIGAQCDRRRRGSRHNRNRKRHLKKSTSTPRTTKAKDV
ncbi:WIF1 [Cordylochernes scorpioides]|uniref:Wnt inhibitory factor 1 n=1 Tax=Cordylochernes scorpioides TaxID=51811 RepID=A0ABY6KL26_9ARAC|nr:WIF1 [Cordylochernes scorpioides]